MGWLSTVHSARPRSDSASVHVRAQSAARAGSGRGLHGGDAERDFVRTSVARR
jgi:hypothetical protein